MDQFSSIINGINEKEGNITDLNNQMDTNKALKDTLEKRIDNLNKLIDSGNRKTQQANTLTDQLNTKNQELEDLKRINTNNGTSDRAIWTDFTAQLGKLNWANLNNNDGGTTGVNKLATELKGMVDKDFPEFASDPNLDTARYEEVIRGYVNRQGFFDTNQDKLGNETAKNVNYIGDGINQRDTNWNNGLGTFLSYDQDQNRRVSGGRGVEQGNSLFNYLEKENTITKEDIIDSNVLNYMTSSYKEYDDSYKSNDIINGANNEAISDYKFQKFHLNLKNIINKNDNILSNINKMYEIGAPRYYQNGLADYGNGQKVSNSLLKMPPILEGQKAKIEFIQNRNLEYFVKNTFKNEIGRVDNGIVNANNVKAFITANDIAYLKEWNRMFRNDFYDKIDFNTEDGFIFDKQDYLGQLAKVKNFSDLIKNYTDTYDAAMADPDDVNKQIQLVALYNQIRVEKDKDENYYENIVVKLKDSTLKLLYDETEATAAYLQDAANKLKLYDTNNAVIKGVLGNATDIDKKIKDKQAEIDRIQDQINKLQLTPEESTAIDTKTATQGELDKIQPELDRLEQEKAEKERELNELNEQLKNTSFKDKGVNSVAHGNNAFASGASSTAIGDGAEAIGDHAIALGTNSKANATEAIAIGKDSKVTGEKSSTIGVGNTVTGNNNFVAGNSNTVGSNNTVVIGNNITVAEGFDDTVVLGSNSVATKSNPTASYEIGGKTYNFAGANPTSTVSVGAEGKERQITNVAAGRISDKSTDAINGSQLYALAEAVKNISINPADISDAVDARLNDTLTAGDNITITKDEDSGNITISGKNTQSTVVAGNGVTVESKDNDIGTKDYTVSVSDTLVKAGNNVEVTGNAKDGFTINAKPSTTIKAGDNVTVSGDVENGYTISAKPSTTIKAGNNVTVTGDSESGYTINATVGVTEEQLQNVIDKIGNIVDTNTQSVTKAGQGVVVTEADNAQGTKDYTVSVKAGDGLGFDGEGNLTVNGNLVKAGDNVTVTGNAKDGFIVSAENMRTTVKSGDNNITVEESVNADGSKTYTTTLNPNLDLTDKGSVKIGDVNIANGNINMGGNVVNGVADGKIAQDSKEAINGAQLYTTNQKVEQNTQNINKANEKIAQGLNFKDENGNVVNKQLGETLTVKGDDKNISTQYNGKGELEVKLADNVKASSFEIIKPETKDENGNTKPASKTTLDGNGLTINGNTYVSDKGLNAGGNVIDGVADGEISENSKQAVNGGQIYQFFNRGFGNVFNEVKNLGDRVDNLENRVGNLDNKVEKYRKKAEAGTSSAIATSNIPQVITPGKSTVGVGVGGYKGQNAIAVGYSRASDNGKHIIKFSATANTQKGVGYGAGYSYQY